MAENTHPAQGCGYQQRDTEAQVSQAERPFPVGQIPGQHPP